MGKGKGRNSYPSWYGRNAARNAERRYLLTQTTKAQILTEKRQKVAGILSKYIQLSLVKHYKVSQEQIDKIGAEMDACAAWYNGIADIQGEKRAVMLLKERTADFLPDRFWMPSDVALSMEELSPAREAGDLTCRFWCVAINKVLGFDKGKLTKVLRGANAIYKADDVSGQDEADKAAGAEV